jgi:hypothetical protein
MARHHSAALLLCAVLGLLAASQLASGAPDGLGNDVYAMPAGGPKIVFIGSSPNVKLYPNSSSSEFLLLKFGSVAEATQDGTDIRAHTIPSLATLRPVVTTGMFVNAWRIERGGGARARAGRRGVGAGSRMGSERSVCQHANTTRARAAHWRPE